MCVCVCECVCFVCVCVVQRARVLLDSSQRCELQFPAFRCLPFLTGFTLFGLELRGPSL